MRAALPWLRSLVAMALCVVAFEATHRVGARLSPGAYEPLRFDSQRVLLLCWILAAGVVATATVVAVARHRAWAHVALLFVVGLAIDLGAVFGELGDQPLWFRAAVIGLLPLQALAGMRLGTLTWRTSHTPGMSRISR